MSARNSHAFFRSLLPLTAGILAVVLLGLFMARSYAHASETHSPTMNPAVSVTYTGSMQLWQDDSGCNFSAAPYTTGEFTLLIDTETGAASGAFSGGGSGTRTSQHCGDWTGDLVWEQSYTGAFSGAFNAANGDVTMSGSLSGNGSNHWEDCEENGETVSCPGGSSGGYSFPIDVLGTVTLVSGSTEGDIQVNAIGLPTYGIWDLTGPAVEPTPTPTPTEAETPAETPTFTPTATLAPTDTLTPTNTPTLTPTPSHDLTVDDIEVVQVVQCMDSSQGDTGCADNSVPLVALKQTAARVYVGLGNGAQQPISGVTAQLRAFRDGDELDGSPLRAYNGSIRAVNVPQRLNTDDTVNFRLPQNWVFGNVTLEAEVNPGRTVSEQDYNNNTDSVVASFAIRPTLRIAYIPIRYQPPGAQVARPPTNNIETADWLLRLIYPTDAVEYIGLAPFTWKQALTSDEGQSALIAELNRRFALETGPVPDQLVGWIMELKAVSTLGISDPLWDCGGSCYGRVAWAMDEKTRAETLAHEVAHNFGLRHVTSPNSCDADNDDESDWPYSDPTIQEVGFDAKLMGPVPSARHDLMSYCPNEWISPHSYKKLFNGRFTPRALSVEQPYLLLSGVLYAAGGGQFEPAYRFTNDRAYDLPPVGSDYCLVLQDAAGVELAEHCVAVSFVNHESRESMTQVSYALVVPDPGDVAAIVLRQSGADAATLVASDNAPTVIITSPTDSDIWEAEETVAWNGNDADGDPLTYAILYSKDDGVNWTTLVTNLTDTSYVVDALELAGSSVAKVRVLASDGLNSGQADSVAFTVTAKGPRPRILSPVDGTELVAGQPALLDGDAYDLEDGVIKVASLTWLSDRDGALGMGRTLSVGALSVGEHTITLAAEDQDGNVAEASVVVTVLRAGDTIYLPVVSAN